MIIIQFIILILMSIPIISVLDYICLRKYFEMEFGFTPSFFHYLIPTFLELFCFSAGLYVGFKFYWGMW